jgi:hypothetical protein
MCKQVTHEVRNETTSSKYRTDNLLLGDQNHFLYFSTISEFLDVFYTTFKRNILHVLFAIE